MGLALTIMIQEALDNFRYRELQQHLQNDIPESLVIFDTGGDGSSHPAVAGGVQLGLSTRTARRFVATPIPTEFP